jgi:NAD(P)-dependent dehydrogenase (short-subunit alcohol dehydrogenase family)
MTVGGLFDLHDKVAVVTGASSGLGARFARVLAGAGATVILAARRQEAIERLAEEVGGIPVVTDLRDESALARLMDQVMSSAGRLDVLVNNAGAVNLEPAEDEQLDRFRSVIELNLVAQFALCQLAARLMLTQGQGSIVNIASVVGLVGVGQMPQASYAASKGGLISLTRELAAQWARRGVRVNAIAPGWFPSEMTAELFADARGQQWLRRKVPMGRGGRDGELDGALLFLASDASCYVTGQVVAVDGGFTAT